MARAKKRTGRGKPRPVRDLAAKPAATARGGETKLKRFSATMYTEQVKLTLNEYDA